MSSHRFRAPGPHRVGCAVALCAAGAVASPPAAAPSRERHHTVTATPLPNPVEAVGDDALAAVGGYQWIYLASAVAATAAMSPSGADHSIRLFVQKHARVPAWGDTAYYAGYVLPVLVPASLYVAGLVSDDRGAAGGGSAAIEALAFTEIVTVVLKVGTGRPFPLHGGDPNAPDRLDHPGYAREYAPFGFAGRYAWPSGHTAAAFSVAASLTAYYDSWIVPFIAYPIATAIGFGMLTGDRHWASDVVAGGLLGQGIGWSVGKSFSRRASSEVSRRQTVHLLPLLSPEVQGLAVFGEL